MSDLDLIKADPRELIDLIKSAYYTETGETLQIGSDEYAAAAAFAYVWSVLIGRVNNATLNRFIDSANGIYLDAIASNYGITHRPDGHKATAIFTFETYLNQGTIIPAHSIVVSDDSGNDFTNDYDLSVGSSTSLQCVLYAVGGGSKYNGIPANSITTIIDGGVYVTSCTNTTMTDGGTDALDDDDDFREWLKIQIQTFAGAGTYAAYQARAVQADSRVKDVYVLRQDDAGYQKGRVNIFIVTDNDPNSYVREIVQNYCSDEAFRPIGDLVVVDYSPIETESIAYHFQVTYPQRFMQDVVTNNRNDRILAKYNIMLQAKIGKPFVFEEFCALLCEKDENGVYAVDAKPLWMSAPAYPTPIYPVAGGRVYIPSLIWENAFDPKGA